MKALRSSLIIHLRNEMRETTCDPNALSTVTLGQVEQLGNLCTAWAAFARSLDSRPEYWEKNLPIIDMGAWKEVKHFLTILKAVVK